MDNNYDINKILADMELELIKSYKRNMAKHMERQIEEGFEWTMWQEKKLADLRQLRTEARKIVDKHRKRAVYAASGILVENYSDGKNHADVVIKGFKKVTSEVSFGKADRRKLDALIDAVNNDFTKASHATLRLVDDGFRQIVYKTQFAYSAGATTLHKAVDKAATEFLQNGINSITYKNGAKVNIASYCEMVMRTSAKKAYLTGEGTRNAELGVDLVQITSYGGCSDTCLPWQGGIYIDDVYSGGTPRKGYILLSEAMANGLFHPNCRHTMQPFFEGVSDTAPIKFDEDEVREKYQAEQRQREIERNIRKYKRVKEGSLDDENISRADRKVKDWQLKMREHLDENQFLTRKYAREKIV